MGPIEYILALIGAMHGAIAMRMLPASGEMNMSDDRVKALVADTFAAIREAHAAIVKASEEDAETKTKREANYTKAKAEFMAQYEAALQAKQMPKWAIAYKQMMLSSKPAGGDKATADEIQKHHDKQRNLIVEAFAVTNPYLADADKWIPRLGTKGRPAGSRNKAKEEAPATADAETSA